MKLPLRPSLPSWVGPVPRAQSQTVNEKQDVYPDCRRLMRQLQRS